MDLPNSQLEDQEVPEYQNDVEVVFDAIREDIRVGDMSDLQKHLKLLDCRKISASDLVVLLDVFINDAYNAGENEAVEILFDHFDKENYGEQVPTLSVYLFRNKIEPHLLSQIARSVFMSYEETMKGIIEAPMSYLTYEACLNAEKIYGEPSMGTLIELYDEAKTGSTGINVEVERYILNKLSRLTSARQKPNWIVNAYNGNDIPFQEELEIPDFPVVKLRSPEIYARSLQRKLKYKSAFSLEYMASHYAISTLEHKIDMLNKLDPTKKFKLISENDTELFLIYGPNNTQYNQTIEPLTGTVCEQYGGCRMFLCTCAELANEDTENVDEIEWFKGYCDVCGAEIAKRHWSLRKPLKLGGWLGCYCSQECIISTINKHDTLSLSLVDRLTNYLVDLGIQDRRYSDQAQSIV